MSKKVEIITRPGGYEAWRDDTPIRRTNTKAVMFAVLFMLSVCGGISGITGYVVSASNQPTPEMITLMPSPEAISSTQTNRCRSLFA